MYFKVKKSKLVKKIFCVLQKKKDNKFNKICKTHKINIFRGSTNNVLERFINCVKKLNSIETIVRITADCPIIDAKLIDECIKLHFRKKSDYTSNTLKFTFPDGLDVK